MTETAEDADAFVRASVRPTLWRRILRKSIHALSYHFILKRNVTRVVRAAGFRLIVPPTVFHPRYFLASELAGRARLRAVVALGRIAHDSIVVALGGRLAAHPFSHAARHEVGGFSLYDSYHCSRYNTNTGRLTPEMFRAVFAAIRAELGSGE